MQGQPLAVARPPDESCTAWVLHGTQQRVVRRLRAGETQSVTEPRWTMRRRAAAAAQRWTAHHQRRRRRRALGEWSRAVRTCPARRRPLQVKDVPARGGWWLVCVGGENGLELAIRVLWPTGPPSR